MLPEIDVIHRRDPALVCEDTFNEGLNGWTQLLDGTVGTGPLTLDTEITHHGSRFSMMLSTEDYSYNSAKPWGSSVAVKRLSRGPVVGKIYTEWWFAYGALRAQVTSDSPRTIDFGIDQCDPTGSRRFYKVRWLNVDENASNAIVSKWQVLDADGVFKDVPGAAVPLGVNENKRNLYHLETVLDLNAGKYDGMRINGQGFGSLATTPDDTMRAFGPTAGTLAQFAAGLNGVLELTNRTNTDSTKCWANLAYFKAVNV